jgi:S1-C subfamily serine protease
MGEGPEDDEQRAERQPEVPAAGGPVPEPPDPPVNIPPAPLSSGSPGTGSPTGGHDARRRSAPMIAAVALVLLLAGGAAGAGVLSTSDGIKPPAGGGPAARASPKAGTHFSVSRISSRAEPAIVDVDTKVELADGSAEAAGTGMIVTSDGYIVTNNHVVEGATSIEVTIAGRGQFRASFVGASRARDVAVIKVSGLTGLPVVRFGNSSTLEVGDPVVAIGNALGLGGAPTVTSGTVHALTRSIVAADDVEGPPEHLRDMIETNTPIEPGNSGGPLLDAFGQVVGMNTAATPSTSGGQSFGFALPANSVAAIASEIERGRGVRGVALGLPAFLGISGDTIGLVGPGPATGVNVLRVVSGAPAAKAGMAAGDVIVKLDGTATASIAELSSLVHRLRPGDRAMVTYVSGSRTVTTTVSLTTGPAP